MPEPTSTARIVLTTAANPEEANRLGRTLVEEHLAACATLIPAVESIYRWKGKIETSSRNHAAAQDRRGPVARLSRPGCTNCTATRRRSSWSCRSSPAAVPISHG